MTYPVLALLFFVAAAVVGLILAGKAHTSNHPVRWVAVAVTAGVLVALTAVFDSVMIGLGLFSYPPELLLGIRVGLAPLEDFAYPLAIIIALPALWGVLNRPDSANLGLLMRNATVASRPVSWINTAFPFGAAMLLTTRELDWLLVVGMFYYLIPYNLAMYGINDVFDYASDLKNPRKGGIEGGVMPPEMHRPILWLVLVTNVPFLVVLVAAGNPAAWVAIGVSTFAVIAYSAPVLRFKERPVLDSITSSTHFVSPAVVGFTLAGATFDAGLVLLLAAFFLWGMAAHAFGAVQDIQPDRDAGIGSIATVIGARHTVRLAMALWLGAGILMLFVPWPGPLAAAVALPYLINCAPWWNVSDADAGATNRAWRRFIWLNYASGFVVTLVLIAEWVWG